MRVLAVTADASLVVALTSMMREWEVQSARTAEAAVSGAIGAEVALVDFGTTDEGLSAAQALLEQGVTIPCLIIGDRAAPAERRASVIIRPFTLPELNEAIGRVLKGEHVEPATAPEEPALEVPPPSELPPPAEPEPRHEGAHPRARFKPAPATAAKVPPEPAEPAVIDLAVAEEPPQTLPPEAAEPVETAADPAPPVLETAAEPAAPALEAERAPEPPRAPPPQREKAPPGGIRRFLRRRPQREAPAARAEEGPPEDPTLRRLREALEAGRLLENLLDDLPALIQARAMAHAFLAEVVELFGPETAAVYTAGADGTWRVVASHGLSVVEVGMQVHPDQPLFMEVTAGLEAILIAPIDLAQGLVSGIGGARTEAIIAAPIEVGGICYGLIVVGRREFSEFDLEVLSELADEAAPGLAVSHLLERLRSR